MYGPELSDANRAPITAASPSPAASDRRKPWMPLFGNVSNLLGPGVLISTRTVITYRVQISDDIAFWF